MNLSDNLKKIRKDNNLSQEQLAEKLGVSRQSVSKWESNQAYPEMDKVLQICQMFNLNVDELLNQNIKEVKEKKESKSNINKYMDDFLGFITKTVDMFSSLKFKEKIKCLFEQCIIFFLLILLFLIIGSVCSFIFSNIFDFLPYSIYSPIFSLLEGLYIIVAIIIGVVIFLHIFKTRYLDYYVIVKKSQEEVIENNEVIDFKEDSNDKEISKTKEKVYLEKKEKIIIRDPNHSQYRFIKGLLKCVLFFIKVFVFCIAICFLISLVSLVICLVLSFLFIKTGLLFIGVLIILISSIVINLLILYILYNFIFSKKTKKNKAALVFIISILMLSIGIGLTVIGIKDFDYINDVNSKYYIEAEKTITMNDSLLLDDGYYDYGYYHFQPIDYIETSSNDVRVVCKHSKHYMCDINIYNNKIYTHIYQNDTTLMEQVRQYITDINNKKVVDYSNYKIIVYTSKENIEKLENNKIKYIEEQEKMHLQEQYDYYEQIIEEKEEKIEEQEQIISELEEKLLETEENLNELQE